MKITIEDCRNGAYVIFDDGENQDRYAYRFDEDNLDGLQEMLYDIKEQFYTGSKHDRFRVHVVVEHGTEYECKGCDICGIKKGIK